MYFYTPVAVAAFVTGFRVLREVCIEAEETVEHQSVLSEVCTEAKVTN
jgi:hypothetical protein